MSQEKALEPCCGRLGRREFLSDLGMGFSGLALGSLLFRDGLAPASAKATAGRRDDEHAAWRPPDGKPHFRPKAKSVIWIFMKGGVSHLESFDPKQALNTHAGKSIAETPFKTFLESKFLKNVRSIRGDGDKRHIKLTLYPMQVGFSRYGASGIEIADWWPEIGSCADDIAFVRSVWTSDNKHFAQLQYHTGRHSNEGAFPTIGSWVHYGLGSLNENLPQFVVLGPSIEPCCGGDNAHGADYLGPLHAGVRLNVDPDKPLPFSTPGKALFWEEQKAEFDLLGRLNRIAGVEYPDDPMIRARIRSYELAFRMQSVMPQIMRVEQESRETKALYGLDRKETREFGQICLAARKLVERGVRFVQVFHGGTTNEDSWDSHWSLKKNLARLSTQVDRPIGGLLKDLKQRGLLEDTLVVWATEFGRTPGRQSEAMDGRDHNPMASCAWMAGGGVKGGIVHGATDEIGFHAVENRHYVTDIHATVLHQLGLDPRKLEVPGRKRLDVDFGKPIREIIA